MHRDTFIGRVGDQKELDMLNVFVGHPIGGDIERNMDLVEAVCGEIFRTQPEIQPLAPYLLALRFLDDNAPTDRLRGIAMNREFFLHGMVDELWLFGPKVSTGMWEEVGWARKLGIPVLPMTDEAHLDLIRGELKPGEPIQLQGCGPCPLFTATFVDISDRDLPIVSCPAGPRVELYWGDIVTLAPAGVPLESPKRYNN